MFIFIFSLTEQTNCLSSSQYQTETVCKALQSKRGKLTWFCSNKPYYLCMLKKLECISFHQKILVWSLSYMLDIRYNASIFLRQLYGMVAVLTFLLSKGRLEAKLHCFDYLAIDWKRNGNKNKAPENICLFPFWNP